MSELEISVDEVKRLLDTSEEGLLLVDCRTEAEVEICRLDGAVHVPLGAIESEAEDLLEDAEGRPVVVYCHHGVRSKTAALALRALGVATAVSMRGGIDAWSERIDPGVPRY
ncbi:MAG: rhodanese-like domain-containing protein [Phycisphaerales bacterium]